jgi:hypothetical protein
MKKCPPGVICIENISLIILALITLIIFYLVYQQMNKTPRDDNVVVDIQQNVSGQGDYTMRPDVLLNPYTPPLRNDRYYMNDLPRFGIRSEAPPMFSTPVNVSTNIGAVDTSYRQVGILTPINSHLDDTSTNKILPLMGRPLFTNRDKWQFYTTTKNHIKLPVTRNGKSGTSEYGCDNIYDGDTIYVKGYNDAFRASVYDNDTIRYIPSL